MMHWDLGVAQRKTLPLDNIEADRAGFDPGHADHDDEGRAEEVHDPRRFEEKVDARRHCVGYQIRRLLLLTSPQCEITSLVRTCAVL